MGRNENRGWKPWARDFNSLVFGIKHKKSHDANPDWTRKVKQARQNKKTNTIRSVQQESKERPVLVQKNRISSKRSLRIK